jgi:hypothetical protein
VRVILSAAVFHAERRISHLSLCTQRVLESDTLTFSLGGTVRLLSIDRRELSAHLDSTGWFVLHATLALMVGPVLVFFVVAISSGVFANSRFLFLVERGGFLNPLFWGPGFVLGLLVNRVKVSRFAGWVWLLGAAWLVFGILDSLHGYDPRWYQGCTPSQNIVNAFFVGNSRKCGGGTSTLEGILFTLPAATSAAYSLGAWLGLLSRRRSGRADMKQNMTTPGLGWPRT